MKKSYTVPSCTMIYFHCSDIITASVQDDDEEFNLGWIGLA